ncbi:P-loop containing nucleoside triphosphate hydrolase protein [Schizophyllum amplum]|uniref:DNA 3'-5' helicase n=1 Tax=Schizophyllum amplum TaxID=97359 RepID=A0A550BVG8_9AGAR|nr:P-loop containing nucleoside triphosphate hydrolase protein [Auriculariopsis ampla]
MSTSAQSLAASHHEVNKVRSAANLQDARDRAFRKRGYNYEATRSDLSSAFRSTWGYEPREWQLDITEALLLGLDSVLIAGTGAGKTMPFMLPLKYDEQRTILVISPLKILQEDQAHRFTVAGIPAVAVNGDTWATVQSDLNAHKYRAILTSPEMCLEFPAFRQYLSTPEFQRHLTTVAVDEAHCIGQWGGDFRKHYAMLHKLRALFPSTIPFLAATATLPPAARDEVCAELNIDLHDSYFVNLGNDRPNITQEVRFVESAHDYAALAELLPTNARTAKDIPKTLIFVNSRVGTQEACREIRKLFPRRLRKRIDFLHAVRKDKSKRRVMRRFRRGSTRILVATEAAGMGADIPDIMQVIQLGVPQSLSVYLQRAGRGVRDTTLHGRAILLVEKSVFRKQKKRKKKGKDEEDSDEELDVDSGDEGDNGVEDIGESSIVLDTAVAATDEASKVWVKEIDPALRTYIASKVCRHTTSDKYFDNPPGRQAPTGPCCDVCEGTAPPLPNELSGAIDPPTRPSTPVESPHVTPASTPKKNGKRPMQPSNPARRGELLKRVRTALQDWRVATRKLEYPYSTLTATALMPDKILNKIASNNKLRTVDDLRCLDPPWIYASKHGGPVIAAIEDIVGRFVEERDREVLLRRAEKALQTRQKHEQKRQEEETVRLEKRTIAEAEKARKRAEEKIRATQERERKARAKAAATLARDAAAAQRAAKYASPRPVLAPSTPLYAGSLAAETRYAMAVPPPMSPRTPLTPASAHHPAFVHHQSGTPCTPYPSYSFPTPLPYNLPTPSRRPYTPYMSTYTTPSPFYSHLTRPGTAQSSPGPSSSTGNFHPYYSTAANDDPFNS